MKQHILSIAKILMTRGPVSTLQVKNALHSLFSSDPTFSLKQAEVSAFMHELFVENNWCRNLNTTSVPNASYYEYTEQPVVVPVSNNAIIAAVFDGSILNQPVNLAASNPAGPTRLNRAPLDISNGMFVSYVRGHIEQLAQADKKSLARTTCFNLYNDKHFGLTHDDINTCTVEYYNKHKLS